MALHMFVTPANLLKLLFPAHAGMYRYGEPNSQSSTHMRGPAL